MYRYALKRLLDFIVALLALVVFSPLIVITYVLLKFANGGKAFFFQERPGYKEKAFYIIKFKTMRDDRDAQGNLLPDVERTTKIGKRIRSLSIDELPQLINVLKGDMSLVGPRPLLFKYIPLYSAEQRKRHLVKPGITGLAQVSGRNSISWTKKFELDTLYADQLSFALDIKILWLTAIKVVKREGINQTAERPMQPFNGSN
ncbi:sugar transferase [Pedobacter sp. SL55]|uniref:sugar transferase n=1 Tax=Pedobacter sp. SL55 TaxID=2995161 RepID=UPI00226FA724|nr:sugar transferase [Pedobacter sp. SL55]WAC40197.1 sugar transferase [Pedobacter sp. SL55]